MTSEAIGLKESNSLDYVEKAITALNSGKIILNLKASAEPIELPNINVGEFVATKPVTGWYSGPAYEPSNSENIAQILFSSGTEGAPKAIYISHRALANTTRRLIDVMSIDSSIREYVGVPVNYSFGFGRCRVVSSVGGQFYIPPHGFDPLEIVELLKSNEINAISAVPTLWRLVLDTPEIFEGYAYRVKWIEIGSQYMSSEEKTKMVELFPNATIVQHYGLTEASRSTFLKLNEASEEELQSVGKPLYGVEVKTDEDGRIFIKGDHVAQSIFSNGNIGLATDENGWLATNDHGELVGDNLFFKGRIDDIINCGGVKVSPDKLDQEIQKLLNIKGGVCSFRCLDEVLGDSVGVAILESLEIEKQKVLKAVRDVLSLYGIKAGNSVKIYSVKQFPYTPTGKLKRKALTDSYEKYKANTLLSDETGAIKKSVGQTVNEQENSELANRIKIIWTEALGAENISIHESFFDLGGDSLSAIRVMIKMQSAGISREVCQRIFEGKTIAELVAFDEANIKVGSDSNGLPRNPTATESTSNSIARRTPLATASLSINIVRGLFVLLNIASHWMPAVVARLPPIFQDFNRYLSPLYSSGTPGFVLVFGMGMGFFLEPIYRKNKKAVFKLVIRNASILGVGLIFMSIVRTAADYTGGEDFAASLLVGNVWNILAFYFVALLTMPMWLKLLSKGNKFFTRSLYACVLLYGAQEVIDVFNIPPSENAFVQLGVLLLNSNYNYPEIFAGVLLGAAVGSWLRSRLDAGLPFKMILNTGMLLILFALVLSSETSQLDMWFIWPKEVLLWAWPLYLGFSLILFVCLYRYVEVYDLYSHAIWSGVLKVVSIFGIMAFPIYAIHSVIVPLKRLLENLGVPGALPLSLLVFALVMVFLLRKIYSMHYGGGARIST